MSIDYCPECEHIVEGETHTCECQENTCCDFCGAIVQGLAEDDPREDR